jgi:endonuclease YncB( thermonuclease family)
VVVGIRRRHDLCYARWEGSENQLNGIDSPEKGHSFGQRAKQYASEMAFNKTVMVKDFGKDRYGRTIGDVLSEDVILNQEMVGRGVCECICGLMVG